MVIFPDAKTARLALANGALSCGEQVVAGEAKFEVDIRDNGNLYLKEVLFHRTTRGPERFTRSQGHRNQATPIFNRG